LPQEKIVMNVRSRWLLFALTVAALGSSAVTADDWPQWRGPTRDGVWRETGLVDRFASAELTPRWRVPISAGYSGPTVADGRVYVTDRVAEPKQIERVHCFDWKTGERIWSHSYDCVYRDIGYTAGPRAAVTISDGRAYSLGAMGHFFCFDAASGEIAWKHDLNSEYKVRMPIWGLAAAPLVVDDLIILQVGGEHACLVAFDKVTGEERWRAMDDDASYSAPIMIEQAGRRVLVCWAGQHVAGLEPTIGQVLWSHPFPPSKMVLAISTPVVERDHLFVTGFYDGSLMLRLDEKKPAVEAIWRRVGRDEEHTDSLQSLMVTPYLKDNYVFGVDSYGELRCLAGDTGDRIWQALPAGRKVRWFNIHMVENQDKIWMFNERGEVAITRLSPQGYEEISKAKLIKPTREQLNERGGVCWAHPAFAYRHIFARNDEELVAADLTAKSE
jgi:outer membrane protein assembly factor BamB